ncbi:hypothetical protein E2562_009763 [Oryza meyeriana var. granulata]|uniref:DUF834 domain-containing protein n=1 Tax=Oryza meyeriana var. granulata TaxID=110450 RepID=A0A6G1EAW3_9ORYZ|nr:hypothetical protein E2562_009763 [Oryza meyeriana var. granulata]
MSWALTLLKIANVTVVDGRQAPRPRWTVDGSGMGRHGQRGDGRRARGGRQRGDGRWPTGLAAARQARRRSNPVPWLRLCL